MMTIKNIAGENIEVTNLDAAIEQCERCKNSPFKTSSGHIIGEDHAFVGAVKTTEKEPKKG